MKTGTIASIRNRTHSQLDLFTGHPRPATGNAIRNQLAEIMENEPETVDDEDLLAARWLEKTMSVVDTMDIYPEQLARIIRCYRKANIRGRRQELRHLYPYSPEEEARRQARSRQGPPG